MNKRQKASLEDVAHVEDHRGDPCPLGQEVEDSGCAEGPQEAGAGQHLEPVLKTFKVAPNSFFNISKERVRSDLRRLKTS